MEIIRYLKNGNVEYDKSTFSEWEQKVITTKKAIQYFRKNNKIPEDITIEDGEFERLLNSLGYFRMN